jgi:hypothetical protein
MRNLFQPYKTENDQMQESPIARRSDLIIEELPDEVLVYDLTTDKAHCLNQTAALIWKHCDGQKSADDIARSVAGQLKTPISKEVVKLGLEELSAYGLLKEETKSAPSRATMSRRRLIRNLGLTAAVGLPVIVSITAPTAAHAQSPAPVDPCIANPAGDGCPCAIDSECDSANCNAGTCGPPLLRKENKNR